MSDTDFVVSLRQSWSLPIMLAVPRVVPSQASPRVSASGPRVTYLGHATTLIEIDGLRILTDPLLRQRTAHLRRAMRMRHSGEISSPDIVLISHMHWDHLDIPSLRKLPPGTKVIGPRGSGPVLRRAGLMNTLELTAGDSITFGQVVIEATPANHDGGRPPFGPSGDAVGYLIHGSSSIYFAGDTDLFDEMSNLTPRLDVALLPIWGWGPSLGSGHLNPQRAASALRMLEPGLAIPIHWGTLCPIGLKWTRPDFLTLPPIEFRHAAKQQAPDVDVRVVKPGDRLELPSRTI